MKRRQLLSVVFSLIMFTGVTASGAAFADSDDLDDLLEGFCEIESTEHDAFFDTNSDLEPFRDEIIDFCTIEDEDVREDAIDAFVDDNFPDAIEEDDDVIDSYEDCVEAGGVIGDNLDECTIDDTVFVNNDDDIDETDDDRDEDDNRHELREYSDEYSNKGPGNLRDHFAMYCDMTEEKRAEKMQMHDDLPDDLREKLANYCDLSESEQDSFRDTMMDRMDELHDSMKDKMSDHMDYKKDMRVMLDTYCDMTDAKKKAHVAEHDKAEDHVDKMNRYCALVDETDRIKFIEEHRDEYIAHMKDKMHDKKSDHMDYDRLCLMEASERTLEITDVSKLDRISDWCEMTLAEREDYKMKHHDSMKDSCDGDDCPMDRMHDKDSCDGDDCPMDRMHDFDGMSDMAKDHMSDVAKDRHHENQMKFSDQSDRLKAMIMDKRDISDERHDEIRMKFEAKHGEDSDKKRTEIKMKYKDHMRTMKFEMSDERKSDVQNRVSEMKAYKAELRTNSSDMTDAEKQQLREDFIEKAKDMQLAWITPRTQMTAGIDAAEVECREGYSLVMKVSNGVAMCLKADSALKMIDRGIAVPAN